MIKVSSVDNSMKIKMKYNIFSIKWTNNLNDNNLNNNNVRVEASGSFM